MRWNTPPPAESATSSPMMNTRGSLVMAWSRAWVMAARKVSCAEGVASSPGSLRSVGGAAYTSSVTRAGSAGGSAFAVS